AVDDIPGRGISELASMVLARSVSPGSFSRVCIVLDSRPTGVLFLFGVQANGLHFAGDAGGGVARRRASRLLSVCPTRRSSPSINRRLIDGSEYGWRLVPASSFQFHLLL